METKRGIIQKFKNREVKAKKIFTISTIPKNQAFTFIKDYHYLGDAKFFCYLLLWTFLR
jgi:hypothetical protein